MSIVKQYFQSFYNYNNEETTVDECDVSILSTAYLPISETLNIVDKEPMKRWIWPFNSNQLRVLRRMVGRGDGVNTTKELQMVEKEPMVYEAALRVRNRTASISWVGFVVPNAEEHDPEKIFRPLVFRPTDREKQWLVWYANPAKLDD